MDLWREKVLLEKFPGLDQVIKNLADISFDAIKLNTISDNFLNTKFNSTFTRDCHPSTCCGSCGSLKRVTCFTVYCNEVNSAQPTISKLQIPSIEWGMEKNQEPLRTLGELLFLKSVKPLYLVIETYEERKYLGSYGPSGYAQSLCDQSTTWEVYPMNSFDLAKYYTRKLQEVEKAISK